MSVFRHVPSHKFSTYCTYAVVCHRLKSLAEQFFPQKVTERRRALEEQADSARSVRHRRGRIRVRRRAAHVAEGDRRASTERESLLRTLRTTGVRPQQQQQQQQQQHLESPASAPNQDIYLAIQRQRQRLSVHQEPPLAIPSITQGDGRAPVEVTTSTNWVAPEVNFVMGWFSPEASKRRSARTRTQGIARATSVESGRITRH